MITAGAIDYSEMIRKLDATTQSTGGTVVVGTRVSAEYSRDLDLIAALNGTKKGDILREALRLWTEMQARQASEVNHE